MLPSFNWTPVNHITKKPKFNWIIYFFIPFALKSVWNIIWNWGSTFFQHVSEVIYLKNWEALINKWIPFPPHRNSDSVVMDWSPRIYLFNKIQFWYTLKFENHWCKTYFNNLKEFRILILTQKLSFKIWCLISTS